MGIGIVGVFNVNHTKKYNDIFSLLKISIWLFARKFERIDRDFFTCRGGQSFNEALTIFPLCCFQVFSFILCSRLSLHRSAFINVILSILSSVS